MEVTKNRMMDEKRKVKRIYEIEEIYDERFCTEVGHSSLCR